MCTEFAMVDDNLWLKFDDTIVHFAKVLNLERCGRVYLVDLNISCNMICIANIGFDTAENSPPKFSARPLVVILIRQDFFSSSGTCAAALMLNRTPQRKSSSTPTQRQRCYPRRCARVCRRARVCRIWSSCAVCLCSGRPQAASALPTR